MKIVRRTSGVPGDSRVEYALDVLDGDTQRSIRFIPQGEGQITGQQLTRAGADARCDF